MGLADKAMEISESSLSRYINGKDISPVIRRIIDPLLSINISSYLLEKYYFKYQWLELTDYKSILDFFVRGQYVIPISIFLLVHFFLMMLTSWLFQLTTEPLVNWIKRKSNSSNKFWLQLGQKKIWKQTSPELKSSIKIMRDAKKEAEAMFLFLFKVILVTIFYYAIVPKYGMGLFITMLSLLIILLFVFWTVYLLMEIGMKFLVAADLKKREPVEIKTSENEGS